jgi:uncharacterized protein YbaA (DUF1428 family)
MTYIDGFVAAVLQENKPAYLDHAREALSVFKDHGATRMVENWGADVPVGKVTDFRRSVQKRDGEAVLFSWVEWPSKDVRDAGMKALEQDERMKTLVMPFDGQRMIYGGFSPVVEEGSTSVIGYVDGTAPVPLANPADINMASGPRACSENMARCAWSRVGATILLHVSQCGRIFPARRFA